MVVGLTGLVMIMEGHAMDVIQFNTSIHTLEIIKRWSLKFETPFLTPSLSHLPSFSMFPTESKLGKMY